MIKRSNNTLVIQHLFIYFKYCHFKMTLLRISPQEGSTFFKISLAFF